MLKMLPAGRKSSKRSAAIRWEMLESRLLLSAATQIQLSASADQLIAKHPLTLTATVSSSANAGSIGGVVDYYQDGYVFASAPVTGGTSTLTWSDLSAGEHSFWAVYEGNTKYSPSTSSAVSSIVHTPTVIDWMAVYTSAAVASVGSEAKMLEVIEKAVEQTNLCFQNSHIWTELRLVHAESTSYAEKGSILTDGPAFHNMTAAGLTGLAADRITYGADLMTLFTGTGTAISGGTVIGLADGIPGTVDDLLGKTYFTNAVATPWALDYYVLPHELGHLFGGAHDPDTVKAQAGQFPPDYPTLFPDVFGYRFTVDGTLYHDIMAYEPGETIPYFSNPNVRYKGAPTGEAGVSDSAHVVNFTTPYLSGYESTTVSSSHSVKISFSTPQSYYKEGKAVSLTATLSGVDSGLVNPSGTLRWMEGNQVIGSSELVNGKATFTSSSLSVGSHAIYAIYDGDYTFNATMSTSLSIEVIDHAPPPMATATLTDITGPVGSVIITVHFTAETGSTILESSLKGSNVLKIVGPGGQLLSATFVSVDGGGNDYTGRYRINPPSGVWGDDAAGAYQVWLQPTASNFDGIVARVTSLGNFYFSPNYLYNEAFYLAHNPDVARAVAAGVFRSGFVHFIQNGQRENRNPSACFDQAFYRRANPDVDQAIRAGAIGSAYDHFLRFGQWEGRTVSLFFDASYYLAQNTDVAGVVNNRGVSAYQHFVSFGLHEGRIGTAWFDAAYFLSHNTVINALYQTDLTARVQPLAPAMERFLTLLPLVSLTQLPFSASFNEASYLAANTDVAAWSAATGLSGFEHYMLYGRSEGRRLA